MKWISFLPSPIERSAKLPATLRRTTTGERKMPRRMQDDMARGLRKQDFKGESGGFLLLKGPVLRTA